VKGVPTAALYRNINGKLLLLASKPIGVSSGTLELVAAGASVKLLFNGTLAAFAYDTALATGSVALRTQGGASAGSVAVNAITLATAGLSFSDTFGATSLAGPPSDGAQLNHVWKEQLGNFTLSSGAAQATAKGFNLATVNLTAPAPAVTLSADVNLGTGTAAGLLAQYSGSGDKNYYLGELILVKGVPTVAIYRNLNGKPQLLGSKAVGASSGTLQLVVTATSLTLSFDGTPEVSVTESLFSTTTVGMRASGGSSLSNFSAM